MAEVNVTQADREAFARMDGWTPAEMGWKSIMKGRDDSCVGVQAFARHRIAALEEAAKVAEATPTIGEQLVAQGRIRHRIAIAIRNLIGDKS